MYDYLKRHVSDSVLFDNINKIVELLPFLRGDLIEAPALADTENAIDFAVGKQLIAWRTSNTDFKTFTIRASGQPNELHKMHRTAEIAETSGYWYYIITANVPYDWIATCRIHELLHVPREHQIKRVSDVPFFVFYHQDIEPYCGSFRIIEHAGLK